MSTGTLYLIPAPLGSGDDSWTIPPAVRLRIAGLDSFIVEHPKAARHFLKQIGSALPLQLIDMQVLDEHTRPSEFESLLAPVLAGKDVGLLSEGGCPAVADPGAGLVRLAHRNNIRVIPLVGPSSILLALMASGLNGQRFAFHGYLPVDPDKRGKKIGELEKESIMRDQTQIFIETPYRNQKLLGAIIRACSDDTLLCVAADLTLASESISTRTIGEWARTLPNLHNRPAIFLLYAQGSTNRSFRGQSRPAP